MIGLVLGDTHGKLKLINRYIKKYPQADFVLQCGDFGIWKKEDFEKWGYLEDKPGHYSIDGDMIPFENIVNGEYKFDKPVIFITGNHENFDYRDSIKERFLTGSLEYIQWLDDNEPIFLSSSIKIAGLNGCYSYKVYTGNYQKMRKIKVKPETPPHIEEYLNSCLGKRSEGRFKEKEVKELMKHKADILLLHEAPIGMGIEGELLVGQRPGCSVINEIIEEMQPKFAFIGHIHKMYDFKIGKTQVVVLPMAENSGILLDTDKWEIELVRL